MFEEVMLAAECNRWIAAYETKNGGHFGFYIAYRKDYLGKIIKLIIDPGILNTWLID